MCGWGSNNKYALLSAMRAVNQIISYEVPFILRGAGPGGARRARCASRPSCDAQHGLLGWFVFYPVLGQLAFVAFVVMTLASREPHPVRHRRGGVGAGGGVPGGVLAG